MKKDEFKIHNITRDRGKCWFCGEDIGYRGAFCNSEEIRWILMPANERAHTECYIIHVVEKAYKEIGDL